MRESYRSAARRALAFALVLGAAGVASGEGGVTGYKQGKGGTPVSGAAGTGGSSGDSGLQHCDKPMGALAVVEPQDYIMQSLNRYGLQSPTSLIRMMVQQSNCFIVVERGVGMQNVMQERELAASGAAAPGLEHGRRADGDGGLRAHAQRRFLGRQRGRRRRRARRPARPQESAAGRGGGRPEIQGSADEHAPRRRAQRRAGCGC